MIAGETYLLLDRSLRHLVEHIGKPSQQQTALQWPVSRIFHSPRGAMVSGPQGTRLHARHVLVTVPLAILKRGDIAFEPPLPERKQAALQRLQMSTAVKVTHSGLMISHTLAWEQASGKVCRSSWSSPSGCGRQSCLTSSALTASSPNSG